MDNIAYTFQMQIWTCLNTRKRMLHMSQWQPCAAHCTVVMPPQTDRECICMCWPSAVMQQSRQAIIFDIFTEHACMDMDMDMGVGHMAYSPADTHLLGGFIARIRTMWQRACQFRATPALSKTEKKTWTRKHINGTQKQQTRDEEEEEEVKKKWEAILSINLFVNLLTHFDKIINFTFSPSIGEPVHGSYISVIFIRYKCTGFRCSVVFSDNAHSTPDTHRYGKCHLAHPEA